MEDGGGAKRPKTLEELDADLNDYFEAVNQIIEDV
jgi:hypothetical protein